MPCSCFADRLGDLTTLSPGEQTALARLEERERQLRRGAVLLREGDALSDIFILTRGTMMSYVLLDDGSRQILRFLFPGDVLAASALAYGRSPETIAAITDCAVTAVERTAIAGLLTEHPRLAALIIAINQMERLVLTDRLAGLGRTSTKARIAALLTELLNRMRAIDGSITTTFTLGLTQEEVGDATGLTAVHVNRMLRALETDGLIAREAGRVTILNERALARAGNCLDRRAALDLSWLPPPR